MYDESHIGNPEYSYDYICPNCGYDGSDKDGYCVKCGEYVRPMKSKKRSKRGLPPIVKPILVVVGACAAAFIMFFWGFCVGFDRAEAKAKAGNGEVLTVSTESDKQMFQDIVQEYKSDGLLEFEMQSLLIKFMEKHYSSLPFGDGVEKNAQEMQKDLADTYATYTDTLDQLLGFALDDNYVLEDKTVDRTDFLLTQIKGVRGVWKDALSKYDISFMSLLGE